MNATTEDTFIKSCYILKEEIQAVAKFPSSGCVIPYVIALFVNVAFFFTTIFFNGITVMTIWNTTKLKENVSTFAILMQSICDFASGMCVIPLMTLRLVNDLTCSPSCVLDYVGREIGLICYIHSVTVMSATSFERFMGVLYPFVHRVKVTKSRLLKYVISACSVQTLLYSFSFINGPKIKRSFLAGNSLLFLAFTVFAYTRIFLALIKNKKILLQEGLNVTGRNDLTRKKRFMKELKAAKSCFLVVFTTFMLSFPSLAMVSWIKLENIFLDYTVRNFSFILIIFNFTVHPLIFFWLNKTLKTEGLTRVRNLLNKIMRKRPEVQRAENSL